MSEPTFVFDSPDVDVQSFEPESPSWAFLIQGFVSHSAVPWNTWASAVVCSISWLSLKSWEQSPGGASWSFSYGPGYLFPWGLIVVDDRYSYDVICSGINQIIAKCHDASSGQPGWFFDMLGRFLMLNDDPFLAWPVNRPPNVPDLPFAPQTHPPA